MKLLLMHIILVVFALKSPSGKFHLITNYLAQYAQLLISFPAAGQLQYENTVTLNMETKKIYCQNILNVYKSTNKISNL